MNGAELIATERKRQIEKEGWDKEHDYEHEQGDLALAGASYALDIVAELQPTRHYPHMGLTNFADRIWPWAEEWWKPTHGDPIRQLVKAGALIAAEIDKLQAERDGKGANK